MDSQVQDLIWDVDPVSKPRMTQRDKWLTPTKEASIASIEVQENV
jgi:hypothetical protein